MKPFGTQNPEHLRGSQTDLEKNKPQATDDLRPKHILVYPKFPKTLVYLYADNNGDAWLEYDCDQIDEEVLNGYPFDEAWKAYLDFEGGLDEETQIYNIHDKQTFLLKNNKFIRNPTDEMKSFQTTQSYFLILMALNLFI